MNTTTQQDTKAAANKAAEEGELPFAELSINQKRALSEGLSALEAMADIWAAEIRLSEMAQRIADAPAEQRPGTISAMIEQAFIEGAYRHFLDQKDAADRAARPVANKAEVEQDKIDAERYRWLRNHGDKEGQPPVMLQGRWHGGSNGVGFNLDEAVDSLMGIATPPATTGASTVLTDERIDRAALEKAIEDRISAREDKMMVCPPHDVNERLIASRNALTATLDRLFAAQAGQVAAPTDMTAAAAFIDKRAEQYLQDHADNENDTGAVVFHFGEAGREYHSVLVELAEDLRQASKPAACTVPPAGWNCTRTAGHEGPCAATPSPAKESK
jgi:hypothetical protein